ncbi:hypothetical protein [Bacillus arachidis]|uniref:Uncharacterized protein n=1 Tax=Bacillus arachidis TaxID=2819290 RepID=A0ABS3NYT6_9BACI|nr:hypothetical protein [Bacillus arachidis]MBO1626109.1 hypothetical protein [Bacillus arachidis]
MKKANFKQQEKVYSVAFLVVILKISLFIPHELPVKARLVRANNQWGMKKTSTDLYIAFK